MLNGTLDRQAAAEQDWDVIVIGAGPGGALLASGLARQKLRVLLVESKRFPRQKVCGGCLNQSARRILDQHGLVEPLAAAGAVPIHSLRLLCRGRDHLWGMQGSWAILRSTLDSLLVKTAMASGAEFLPETSASLPFGSAHSARFVDLKSNSSPSVRAAARVVVCADGLSHSSMTQYPQFHSRIARASKIGLQLVLPGSDLFPAGELTMAVGESGYAGITAIDGGLLNIAAAVDPRRLCGETDAKAAILGIFEQNRLPIPNKFMDTQVTGTPPLTRRRYRVASERLFVLGDAAGYVEPFTGEGMAWAFASAQALLPLAVQAAHVWRDDWEVAWSRLLQRKVRNQQWTCHLLSRILRRPPLAAMALDMCHRVPPLRRLAIRQIAGRQPPYIPASPPPVPSG